MEGVYKGKVSLKYRLHRHRPMQFGICNFQGTYKGKPMDERKDCNITSIKGHIGLLHEEDWKCLILKISVSGKNEDITC